MAVSCIRAGDSFMKERKFKIQPPGKILGLRKFIEYVKNGNISVEGGRGDLETETSRANQEGAGHQTFKFIFRKDVCTIKLLKRRKKPTIYEALHLIRSRGKLQMQNSSAADPVRHEVDDPVGQLVEQENLNFIVLNLYNLKEGFELFARADDEHLLRKMSYVKHALFLEEVAKGGVPLKLLELLSDLEDKFIYDKYVIVKVNDCITKSKDNSKENVRPFFSYFTLLKPTYKTLRSIAESEALNEVLTLKRYRPSNSASREESRLGQRRKMLQKEAKLLVQFSDPLLLDPAPVSLREQFQLKNNSLPNPNLHELLQSNWHSTLAKERSLGPKSPSVFSRKKKSARTVEDAVLEDEKFHEFCESFVKLCKDSHNNTVPKVPATDFGEFLRRRIMKKPRHKLPVLAEEFAFECVKIRQDDDKSVREEMTNKTFFSAFRDKNGSFYAKVHYPYRNKKVKPKAHCYKVPNASQLNMKLQMHAKLMTDGMLSNHLRVIHKIPSGPAHVAFDAVPFSRVKSPDRKEYRESEPTEFATDTDEDHTDTDEDK